MDNKTKLGLLKFSKEEKILEAVFKSSFLNLLARGFGYLKNVAIAVFLGFSSQTDGFFMALSLLGIFIIFGDVFDSIGIPNLTYARQKSLEEFKKLSALLFSFTIILATVSVFLSIVLLPLILKVPIGFEQSAIEYTKSSYLLLLPYLFFYFIFHHFGAVLRSLRRFSAFFLGELIFSFFSFLFISIGLYLYKDFQVIPASLSLSQFIATLYILYVAKDYIHLKIYFNDTTKTMLKHFFFLSALYGVFHIYILTDRILGSLLGEKAVSALTYGLLVAGAFNGILKFEHMAITSLSETQGDIKKLNFYLKKLLIITVPLSFFIFLFSEPLIKLFFGHGAFSHLDISLTSTATKYYALSLPFMFIWPILYRFFQIKEAFKAVFITAILGVIGNAVFNYIFVIYLKLGIAGVCLGTFIAYLILCGIAYIIIYKNWGNSYA